ncbi:DUF5719 family protein [Bifidobacterium callitrichidarum]|uniref:Organic solvents resistance ABC transporter permease n=1 Tax=Bifidobacterium callitrichidarum TaxID=2052941 RepID=A0A2U2N8I3_9BIFI|nr:DUF5719 family protein [Bifidobacterium callitrichidarum]PWG65299.1 hypothetical protein DF196_07170 [Bifidobacterium callitrichidarum]
MSRKARKSTSSVPRRVMRVVTGIITMIVLIALFAALMILPGPKSLIDRVQATTDAIDQTVSPTQSETYCPAPMALADSGTYGDSEFQATVGNLATQARYAAFGSVYSASVAAFGDDSASASSAVTLKDDDATDEDQVKTGSEKISQGSRLIDTHMLTAEAGTGTAGSIASWASDGDLKGVSAASCVATALRQSFLLPSTATGTTQQLIVANPSTKPTTVDVSVWGSKSAGKLTMSTQSTLTVPAGGESTLELSAAATAQDGLYATVSSKETPIAAVVRVVSMDGLTSKGSDFAMPLGAASNAAVASSVNEGDKATAYLFAHVDTRTELSWITASGLVHAQDVTVKAGQVSVVDLGDAPKGALGVMSTAEDKLFLTVKASRSGDGDQADFALINAAQPAAYAGLALPDDVTGTITLANLSNKEAKVTIHAYDAKGHAVKSRDVTLGANAAQAVKAADLADGDNAAVVLMVEDQDKQVGWNVRLSHDNLGDGKVAGLAAIGPTALVPSIAHVWARNDSTIVR